MTTPQDRRFEARSAANTRAIVVAPGLELPCLIVDHSATGLRLRLDRNLALPGQVQVIDIARTKQQAAAAGLLDAAAVRTEAA